MILQSFAGMLRSLFQSNTGPKQDETAELAARLEKNVLRLVGNMPTLPDTATRAIALANDPNTSTGDLARLIEADAAIASGLLRIANSAAYSGGAPAVKLPQAVARLGMFPCKSLIISISMKSLLWHMARGEKAQCEALWHHGYVTGCLCRRISQSYRLMFDGGEFSAGLLHDLGRILLLLADPECFARADAMDFREDAGLLERERSAIGIDHCALGACFAENSKLPDMLIEAIRCHHEPLLAENASKLATLVAAADHMANHLQRGESAEEYHAEENAALAHLWAKWPKGRKERMLAEIPAIMVESLQAAAAEQTAS